VRAEVNTELDFNQITTNTESYDPEARSSARPRRSTRMSRARSVPQQQRLRRQQRAKPAPGRRRTGDTANSTVQRTEETVNYEISKKVQTEVKHSGDVKRLSVAVLVDAPIPRPRTAPAPMRPAAG